MTETGNDQRSPRPEVLSESVVVVGGGGLGRRYWGVLLAVGIVAVVFGIIVLANLWASIHLVAIFAGLFLLFAGVLQLFVGGGAGRTGRVISGVLAIAAGILLIVWPAASVKTVAVIVGLSFIIWGVAVAVAVLTAGTGGSGVVAGFGGILAVIGVIFIVWPGPTVTLMMVLVGLSALLFGISAIVQGLALRRA